MDADGVAGLASLSGQVTQTTTLKPRLKFCKYGDLLFLYVRVFFFLFVLVHRPRIYYFEDSSSF